MTFLPYTAMNVSYVLIGSLLVPSSVHWDRAAGLCLVYLLAVGISAHALDATAPNKPWGAFLSSKQLYALAAGALVPALAVGLYYSLSYAPWLIPIGLAEIFFLLAYNLELFRGRFHTESWFAFSWGFLPALAGFVIQTNAVTPVALVGGLFAFFTAYVEINASKPYKVLRRQHSEAESALRFERVLKGVVATVLTAVLLLTSYRILA